MGLDAALLAVYLLIAMTPIMSPVTPTMGTRRPLPADTLDAIVVLSAGVKSDSALNAEGTDRLLISALELMRDGRGRRLADDATARHNRRSVRSTATATSGGWCRSLLWRVAWTIVDSVHTTRDEAVQTAALLLPAGAQSIIVVTSPMHTRRACASLRGGRVSAWFAVPSRERDFVTWHPIGNRDRLAAVRAYVYEATRDDQVPLEGLAAASPYR